MRRSPCVARPWTVLIGLLSLWSGCSCAAAHEIDGSLDDAAAADVRLDMGRDAHFVLVDTGVCSPTEPNCNSDTDCLAWGEAAAPAGTSISSMCASTRCTNGVAHCHVTDGVTRCSCAESLECRAGQVCVSDTPGGPTRCTEACVGR